MLTGTAECGSSITEPLAKVTTVPEVRRVRTRKSEYMELWRSSDRDKAGPTKAPVISDMRELVYFSDKTDFRTFTCPIHPYELALRVLAIAPADRYLG